MRTATSVAWVVLAALVTSASAQEKVTLTNKESPWGSIPFEAGVTRSVVLSADGKHGAYVIPDTGDGFSVVVDGNTMPDAYQDVATDSFVFAKGPAGYRSAFAAKLNDRWHVFESGKPGEPFHEVVGTSLCFSPGGAHLAFVAVRDRKTFVVLDGRPTLPCDSVDRSRLVFNSTGERLAYVVWRNGPANVVLDGKDGPVFDDIGRPVFSGDGAHVAYPARNGARWVVVADGREKGAPAAVAVGTLALSFDGGRLTYAVRTASGMRMVDGEHLGETYEWVFDGSPTFSPDGKRLAYAVRRGRTCAVVVDDKPGKSFDGIVPSSLTFSQDGKRLAYLAEIVREDRVGRHAVVDDRIGPAFEQIRGNLRFSPTGAHLAYIAELPDQRQCLVVDGTAGKPYACIRSEPVFKPNGSAVGAIALAEDERFLAGVEVTARDPAQNNGSRVVFDGTWDVRILPQNGKGQPIAPRQPADDWRTRPLEMRLALEEISFD